MKAGLLALGLIILFGGIVAGANMDQDEILRNADRCNSIAGDIVTGISDQIDRDCDEVQTAAKIVRALPALYIVGGVFTLLGLVMPSGRRREDEEKENGQEEDEKRIWRCEHCDEEFDTKEDAEEHEEVCDKKDKKERRRFCTNCGLEVKKGEKFCSECGTKIGGKDK